jgi:hypothetical protein
MHERGIGVTRALQYMMLPLIREIGGEVIDTAVEIRDILSYSHVG